MVKKGFTLAEVLITLAIIGIVAALTIPAVVKNYQETQLKAQFKKQYSVLTNVINQVNLENGAPFKCYLEQVTSGEPGAMTVYDKNSQTKYYRYAYSECQTMFEKMLEKMGSTSACNQNGCRPKYAEKSEILADGGYIHNISCSASDIVNYYSTYPTYRLRDGAIIFWDIVSFFKLDTNGFRGPNKWGYDLFVLTPINDYGKIWLGDYQCGRIYEKGGKFALDLLKN
jgi:prepilin-type N-terminal cleavage/methylation domain-containing protein